MEITVRADVRKKLRIKVLTVWILLIAAQTDAM